ncbi:MAG: hypothetical protein ACXAAM_06135, partial [Candidatus Heimdallarchaeaceae archaeon]
IKFSSKFPTIKPFFILIAVFLLIPVAITFFLRTWYGLVPILRFNITGGIISLLSLFHAVITVSYFIRQEKESRSRMQLILALIVDIIFLIGGLAAATIYVGPM